ncbi:MAG: nuclear transport factor 2 family protein [Pseudomonadota bacterium]|uniref:nuclear transport factor 2 family protein n=1 Tax=Sphingomonas sp. ERG5 TaxID=1381597 RepID=UPI00054BDF25|nr:nuclear transport factor 2 family protein [Sphingomonas sp. ERG5]
MSGIRDKIVEYYPHIDRVETDWVLALFAPEAIYERADIVYDGIAAIDRFFRQERQIRGAHIIDRLWSDDDSGTVFVTGRFEGQGVGGDAREVKFADIWQFNGSGKVVRRQTYLGLGHAYVER